MGLELKKVKQVIASSLKEDIGKGDITTLSTIPKSKKASAVLIAKERGIICGLDIINFVFRTVDPKVKIIYFKKDGQNVKKGEKVAKIKGKARSLLTAERTILNFLQMMSGVATTTNNFVQKIKESKTRVLDTRKTLPTMRYLQKYAVRCGGGKNHRQGLYDMVLIKDNHISVANGIKNAVSLARKEYGKKVKIEVECSNLKEVKKALESDCDWIMLDNMKLGDMKKAVKIITGRKKIEASGGVNLKIIREIAKTGVDFISVGALTHSYKALDISMRIDVDGNN